MDWLKSLNINFISLSVLLVVLFCYSKSDPPVEGFRSYHPVSSVIMTPTHPTQQHGLEPFKLHFNTYHQLDNNSNTPLKPVINCDIKQNNLASNKVKKIHFNGHHGTRGVVALLFPFHGFT